MHNYSINRLKMDLCPPSKKIRLSVADNAACDDIGWGDDIDVDDDFLQEIETQGYSQYPRCDGGRSPGIAPSNASSQNGTVSCLGTNDDLLRQLQTKTGEVQHLRNEREKHQLKILEKDNVIKDLRKQLDGKDTDMKMQNLSTKSKFNLNTSITPERSQNQNNNVQARFSSGFTNVKSDSKEIKIFDFARKVDQGDVLYKLLESVLNCSDTNIAPITEPNDSIAWCEDQNQPKLILNENDFITLIKSSLLQLCRCGSFEEMRACQLIISIMNSCHELLNRVHHFLSKEPFPETSRSRLVVLERLKDTTGSAKPRDLLQHARLFPSEKGIAARQTFTTIANMIEVHPRIAEAIIESERSRATRWACINYPRNERSLGVTAARPTTSANEDLDSPEKMEVNSDASSGDSESWKNLFVFDVIALAYDIIREITIRNKSAEYENVLTSVLHLYSILCSRDVNLIYLRHESLIINTIQNILFGLPSFSVIRDIVKFLSLSTRFSFPGTLCRRSAAETFSENFKCFNFTKETCMLQVLCVYIEMMEKTPRFVYDYTSWILSSISELHETQWVKNKKDSKLCECLPILEQITIKVILNSIDQYNDLKLPSSSRTLLKSALSRCVAIFQLFRYKDVDFDHNIFPCRGEYRVMLHSLREIFCDSRTENFVDHECLRFEDEQKRDLSTELREALVKSLLESCSNN